MALARPGRADVALGRKLGILVKATGQVSEVERLAADDADPQGAELRQELFARLKLEQIVRYLNDVDGPLPEEGEVKTERLFDRRRERDADGTDHPGRFEVKQGLKAIGLELLLRGRMQLVDVDRVGAQPLERVPHPAPHEITRVVARVASLVQIDPDL